MNNCIFCRIAKKEIPCDLIYEDDKVLAFRDINPQAPTHILIIPRKHIPRVLDIKEEDAALIGHMHLVASKLSRKEKIDVRGFRLVTNCNRDAGQAVFHLHLHLLGGRCFSWPPG
jgi:histidine triad (HIT) family protein